jgi:hypothetical protein
MIHFMLSNSTNATTLKYADGFELIRILLEDGTVSAETCSRYLVNNTNIQL